MERPSPPPLTPRSLTLHLRAVTAADRHHAADAVGTIGRLDRIAERCMAAARALRAEVDRRRSDRGPDEQATQALGPESREATPQLWDDPPRSLGEGRERLEAMGRARDFRALPDAALVEALYAYTDQAVRVSRQKELLAARACAHLRAIYRRVASFKSRGPAQRRREARTQM